MKLVHQVKHFDDRSSHPGTAEAADDGDEDVIPGWRAE